MSMSEGILIVEDDRNWQNILSRLLGEEGYGVELATEYSIALDRILRAGAWFMAFDVGLCVVDLRLAGSTIEENYDGLGLLAISKITGIPAIVVSGLLKRGMKEQLRDQYGIMACFDKASFPEQEFLAVVRRAFVLHDRNMDHAALQRQKLGELEFRTELQNLADTVIDYYKRAYAIINDKQRERRIARGRPSAEDEALWLQQISELNQKYRIITGRLAQVRTLAELDRLHPEIVKGCLEWVVGDT